MNFRWGFSTAHVRWHIATVLLGCVIGVWSAQFTKTHLFVGLPWLLVAITLLAIAFVKQRAWLLTFAMIAGCLFGVNRGSLVRAELDVYAKLYGRTVLVEGVVADDEDVNKRGESVLRLKNVVYENKEIGGVLWVVLNDKKPIERSDVVRVEGNITEGFGTFVGTMYNADIVSAKRPMPGDVALHVRDWFAGLVRAAIPEPEASLGVGFLVGQRRSLPDELANALKVAGLMHIVVASGYNLTILVRLARRSLEKTSKYLATVASGLLIVGFIAITGLSPSMSRAGLVAGLSMAAWYYGRTIHPVVLLMVAMGITVLANPSYAWGDIGWLLSFSSFAGVMICAPLLQAYYFGDKKPGMLRQVIGETVAAWLFTLPILLVTFGQMSNVAVLANLLIVPLIPIAMLLTLVAGLAAWVLPFFAPLLAFPAQALLSYMTQVATWTSGLDWAQREVHIAWWHAVIAYVLLAGFCWYMWFRTRYALRSSSLVD